MEAAMPKLSVAAETDWALPAGAGAKCMLHIFTASVHRARRAPMLAHRFAAS
jgi:hypothetical protein